MFNMKFNIVDATSNKIYDTVADKGAADRRFLELQAEYPKRKLWIKMADGVELKK